MWMLLVNLEKAGVIRKQTMFIWLPPVLVSVSVLLAVLIIQVLLKLIPSSSIR